jgi:hypothetical protein
VEKPLAEEEKAELKELTYRFDRKKDEMAKMYEEAAAEQEQRDRDRRRRPRPNDQHELQDSP